jgi:Bacteriophage T4-like portal protein (Gp20)
LNYREGLKQLAPLFFEGIQMAELFGFEFKRKVLPDPAPSFAPKETEDGALVVAAGGSYGTYVDLDGTVRTEAELVTKYREMALQPECDAAVDEIINESMSIDEEEIVKIDLENLKITGTMKKAIRDEFQNVLNILDFQRHAYEIYRRWYVDGRLYYHIIIDEKDTKAGIKEVRYIDPRKIRKVREVIKKKVRGGEAGEAVLQKTQNEYFIFNDKGFNYGNKTVGPSTTGLRIAKDSILHVTSGLTDTQGTMVLSYLHKAIKALNQLRTLEDALVIYRLARAPERRIWYIDVGNLPKVKAEQYVRDIMVKHKNRLIYDAESGNIRDDRKFMTMLEDYWLPRRDGGKGTEVTTLPGGQTLGQMDDVLYFQKKFYGTLNVPVNRLNSDALFSLGRATEVTRDELKFARFISRLRGKFSALFTTMLEKQLVLKQVMTIEDWQNIASEVKYDFAKDNYFTELKDGEIIDNRINLARNLQDMVGKYYSHEWLRRNILQQSDDDIEEMDKQINEEVDSGDKRWMNPMDQEMIMSGMDPETGMPVDGNTDQKELADDEATDADPEHDKQVRKMQTAKSTYDLLSKKKNRTLSDEAKLKSASQILAKNK